MSKIAVLLPREFMLEQAKKIIEEEQLDIDILRVIKTADSVYEARRAVEEGAGIIVARGGQAAFIKKYTNIPIAEIVLTAQEMGRLIKRAKEILAKTNPSVAIIGFKNMYGDMTYFEEIFDITLKTYFIETIEETDDMIGLALQEGADLIIGGDVANELAKARNVPAIFIESTEDSIRNALSTASKMSYAAELEKTHIAQFETVLDTSVNGIIKINTAKEITNVNRMGEELLGKKNSEVMGAGLTEVIPELESEYIEAVLNGLRDTYTTSIKIAKTSVMFSMAPIQYENRIGGAILTCYKLTALKNRDSEQYREMYLHGYIAKHHFSDLPVNGEMMKRIIEMARMYALSTRPVLIYGEEGTEKEVLAQCIHNNSSYKSGPFVSVNVSSMTEQMQLDRLFGNACAEDDSLKKGALAIGDLGTVLIAEVEKLTPVAQYRLYRAIRYEALLQNDLEKSQTLDNRVIVTAGKNLAICVKEGGFREDLYYLLNGLTLEIPPLRERPRDIAAIVNRCKDEFSKRYAKYLRISDEGMKCLQSYGWYGNELQLECFCERLFLTTPKKTIHEDYVRLLLDDLYPAAEITSQTKRVVVYKHPEAEKINELLSKHQGSRAAVAREMGISATTLWRHMKKYGVNDN